MGEYDIVVPPASGQIDRDTERILAALTTARDQNLRVVLGPGTYRLNQTIVLGGTEQITAVGLVGQGPLATAIEWHGSPQVPAIQISHNKYYEFGYLRLIGPGQGVGILVDRLGGPHNGTMSGNCTWQMLGLDHWGTGLQIGRIPNSAASEMVLHDLSVGRCEVGVELQDYNSLDFVFENLQMGECRVGLRTETAGAIHVRSGSASNNDVDFVLLTGGVFSISGYRSEGARVFAHVAGTTAHTVGFIQACTVAGMRHAEPNSFAVWSGWGGELVLQGCSLGGPVQASAEHAPSGSLSIRGCGVFDDQPFRPIPSWPYPYEVVNCKQIDAGGNPIQAWPSEAGIVNQGARVPAWTTSRLLTPSEPPTDVLVHCAADCNCRVKKKKK